MNPKKTIVGIAGLARSGKDLFTTVAQRILEDRGLKTERFALAKELKMDLRPLLLERTQIDTFTERSDEKVIIRPLLVAYGAIMRTQSHGKYWTRKIEQKIEESDIDVAFITDIRYDEYPEDERYWLQDHMNGKLIHISKYTVDDSSGDRIYIAPPNADEARNNPLLKQKADVVIEWGDISEELGNTPVTENGYINNHVLSALKDIKVIES